MLWSWWLGMFIAGLVIGCLSAWSTGYPRVFMRTLAGPLLILGARLAWPNLFPVTNSPLYVFYVFVDFVIVAVAALTGDYFLGLKLGRHGRDGYRADSVGH